MNNPKKVDISADVFRRGQRGDLAAINILIGDLSPLVMHVVRTVARDHADDAAQNAFVAIFRYLPSVRDPQALPAWAMQIARREAFRCLRPSALASAQSLRVEAADPISDHTILSMEIADTLSDLTTDHQTMIMLRDVYGYSMDEVAAHLEISVGTVKSRLARARDAFRKGWLK